jgi:hypothetical protein
VPIRMITCLFISILERFYNNFSALVVAAPAILILNHTMSTLASTFGTVGDYLRKHSKVALFLVLLALVMLGIGIRSYHLGTQSYWMDEGYTVLAIDSLQHTGSTALYSGETYDCYTYCYPAAAIGHFLKDTPASLRIWSVVAGVAVILVVFATGALLYGRLAGLFAAFFTTFSYYQIAWSRQVRWYTLLELFFWLAFISFYKFLYGHKHRVIWGIAVAVFTLLAIITQPLAYLLPFIFFGWFIIERARAHALPLKELGVAIASFIILLISIEFWVKPGLFIALYHQISLHYELPYYLSFYIRNYWLFLLLSLYLLVQKKSDQKKETWLLVLSFLAYLIPLSFLTNLVFYRYLFLVTPIFFLLGSASLVLLLRQFKQQWQKVVLILVVLIAFFASGEGIWKLQTYYFLESDNASTLVGRPYYAYTPQPDWSGAYGYIGAHMTTSDAVISSMPQFTQIYLFEPGYWIQYDYLGLNDPGYTLAKDGKDPYVGAIVLHNLSDIESLTRTSHGFIVYDYQSTQGRIDPTILSYIQTNLKQVFYEKTNDFSQVWVYQF